MTNEIKETLAKLKDIDGNVEPFTIEFDNFTARLEPRVIGPDLDFKVTIFSKTSFRASREMLLMEPDIEKYLRDGIEDIIKIYLLHKFDIGAIFEDIGNKEV